MTARERSFPYPLALIQLSETLLKSPNKARLDLFWLTLTVGTLTLPGVGEAVAAALALSALALVANDQRDYIESRFGVRGQKFLRAMDMLNGAMLLYGGVRVVHSTALWLDLKAAYTEVRPLMERSDGLLIE